MEEHGADVALLTEAASVLGSLAKGSEDNVKALIEAGAIPVLLNKVRSSFTFDNCRSPAQISFAYVALFTLVLPNIR